MQPESIFRLKRICSAAGDHAGRRRCDAAIAGDIDALAWCAAALRELETL